MHHKRGRAKNQRAGCLMCKPNKMNGWSKDKLEAPHGGMGPLKAKAAATQDLEDHKRGVDEG